MRLPGSIIIMTPDARCTFLDSLLKRVISNYAAGNPIFRKPLLHRIFPIRTCSYYIDEKLIEDKKIKVCLDYHIKKCQGPCEGLVNQQEYTNMIALVIDFLRRSDPSIVVITAVTFSSYSLSCSYSDRPI